MTKFGGHKKQDLVKCLKINNLQSLVVPRMVVKVLLAIVSCIKQSEELIVRELELKSVGYNNPRKR